MFGENILTWEIVNWFSMEKRLAIIELANEAFSFVFFFYSCFLMKIRT